ncbi:hypothetical protein CR513_47881, partial [Mucuna pruriens]
MDKSMIEAASGGALMDKTPIAARHLISNMASNTQHFGIKGPDQSQMVHEIGAAFNLRLENQLSELASLVRQLAIGQHQPNMAAKVCGICTFVEHPTDLCPTLQEIESDQPENVGAIVCDMGVSGLRWAEMVSASEWPRWSRLSGVATDVFLGTSGNLGERLVKESELQVRELVTHRERKVPSTCISLDSYPRLVAKEQGRCSCLGQLPGSNRLWPHIVVVVRLETESAYS